MGASPWVRALPNRKALKGAQRNAMAQGLQGRKGKATSGTATALHVILKSTLYIGARRLRVFPGQLPVAQRRLKGSSLQLQFFAPLPTLRHCVLQ
jgi:hypothetical protein